MEVLTDGLTNPEVVALDVATGKLYWTDIGTDEPQRADAGGFNIEEIVTSGLQSARGIAVDVAASRVY